MGLTRASRLATALFMGAMMALPVAADAAPSRVDRIAAAPARGLPDSQLAPRSVALLQQGQMHLANGAHQAAVDSFEAALAVDPRNRQAFIGLGQAAHAQGLSGTAVRFYREALEIEPNDLQALELQGVALLERGATARANANLERIRKLCAAPCPQADRLAGQVARKEAASEQAALAQEKRPEVRAEVRAEIRPEARPATSLDKR